MIGRKSKHRNKNEWIEWRPIIPFLRPDRYGGVSALANRLRWAGASGGRLTFVASQRSIQVVLRRNGHRLKLLRVQTSPPRRPR